MLSEDSVALADELQARSLLNVLGEERRADTAKIAVLVRRLTTGSALGQPDAHQIKRSIRQLEDNIRQLDRMVDALRMRFPQEPSDAGSKAAL